MKGYRLDEIERRWENRGAAAISPGEVSWLIGTLRDARAENRRLIAALEKRNAPPDDERLARMLDRAQRQANSRPWRAVGRLVRQVQAVTVERDQLRAELAAERAKVAEAWHEGYQDGWSDRAHPANEDRARNPYRAAAQPGGEDR